MLWAMNIIRVSSIKTTDVTANFSIQDFLVHGFLKKTAKSRAEFNSYAIRI
jgi:hypothetical protein